MGHEVRMDKYRSSKQIFWIPEGTMRRGRARRNWSETIRDDLKCLGMLWDETGGLEMDRDKLSCPMCIPAQEGLK